MPTLKDIASELIKPGRDPREDGARLTYSDDVAELEDLKVGMILPGTVTNVTNFGAFVDIGVHQDGLVHISELSDQFVDDPSKVVSVGDVVEVKVIDVDLQRRRIGLSRRLKQEKPRSAPEEKVNAVPQRGNLSQNSKRGPLRPRKGTGRAPTAAPAAASNRGGRPPRTEPQKQYTMEDLLAKFNQRK
jgi:uncharacterized protein